MRPTQSSPWEQTRRHGSPILYVVFGFVSIIVLCVAQLYYFGKLQSAIAELSGFAFGLTVTFATSFLAFCWIAAIRYLILLICAYFGWTHTVRPQPKPMSMPLVSVLLPAFNEAERIAKTLESILASTYPHLEVIVIDDGSTDATLAVASKFAGQEVQVPRAQGSAGAAAGQEVQVPRAQGSAGAAAGERNGIRVRVLRKANGGKSTALNLGFRQSHGTLVMCVDADSHLERNAIGRLVAALQDPDVGAVAGQVRVRNRDSIITRLQAFEYALLNGIPRLAQSNFAHVLIAPGPVAMFQRSVLDEIWSRWGQREPEPTRPGAHRVTGPWEHDTFAEDCDVTLNTLLLGKRVIFEPAAISYTTSPGRLLTLLNQRYRWTRGNIQAVYKSWRRWHEVPNPPRALPVWLAVFLVETMLWPIVSIYGMVMLAGVLIVIGKIGTFLPWYLILLAIEINAAAFSLRAMGERRLLLLLAPLFRSVYSVLLDVNTLCATFDQFRRRRMTWG